METEKTLTMTRVMKLSWEQVEALLEEALGLLHPDVEFVWGEHFLTITETVRTSE